MIIRLNEFTRSKLKLSFWYTLVILFISGSLSGLIYNRTVGVLEHQYQQIEWRLQQNNLPRKFQVQNPQLELLEAEFQHARRQIRNQLLFINGLIILFGAGASYFLAGRTLKPIQLSLAKQKRFVADAAHELKTPITALKTSLEVNLLDKKLPQSTREILQENLQDISSLQSLTDNLLHLARMDSRQLQQQNVNLKTVQERACRHIKPLAAAKEIKLNCITPKKNIYVCGNEDELVELLLILLDNAVKFSPSNTEIKLHIKPSRRQVILSVSDQGYGIDPQHLERIFDRFYQVDPARNQQDNNGFGLGLAVAKQITENHHGKITVNSTENGTIFNICLPRAKQN